jgi:hypothetical protein
MYLSSLPPNQGVASVKQAVLQLIPHEPLVILISAIFFVLLLFLFLIRKYYRSQKLRLPFTRNFLRSPGQSLLKELAYLNQEIMIYIVFLIIIPVYTYAAYISYLYFAKKPFNVMELGLVCLFPMLLVFFSFYKMTRHVGRRRLLRLAFDSQVAVGRDLNQLHREGYHVYHDFPADNFKIDHIVIGSKGIFAIATKARLKPTTKNRMQDATVEYNGRVLRFPKGTDAKTVEQAKRRADWLSEWLSAVVGELVVVRGIVALPGWFVKRTTADGLPVINPKQFASLFEYIQPRMLSKETMSQVVHQLEGKCRDVHPVLEAYESAES